VPSSGSSTNGTLKIVDLSANVATITHASSLLPGEAGEATFIAIVTDTNGLDTIAGGAVVDDTGVTYAAFGTGSTKGAYTATLSWDAINVARPIDTPAGGSRSFMARFFDNAGNVATASVTLRLRCILYGDHEVASCSGVCTDVQADSDNCGGCGIQCRAGQRCQAGACVGPANLGCFVPWDYRDASCTDVCTSLGKACVSAVTGSGSDCSGGQERIPCNEVPQTSMGCTCS
jgi:hypothetical protein